MPLKLGATAISTLRLGTATPSKVMLGASQVWPTAPLWTPADMTTTLWLDAGVSSSMSLVNTDRVTNWRDLKVPATTLGQGSVAQMPRLDAAGKYIEVLQGTFLWVDPSPIGWSPISTRRNVFAVLAPQPVTPAASGQYGRIVSIAAGNLDVNPFQYIWRSEVATSLSGGVRAMASFADSEGSYLPTDGYNFSTEYMVVQSANNGNMWNEAGPSPGMRTFTVNTIPSGNTMLRLGFPVGVPGTESAFRIKELVGVGDLSVADQDRLFGYLAHRHGAAGRLPANHPYKSAPPTK
jgi:hypothetical protein